ncbi:valine--tRNA ligase-like [Haliotis cracherodii]|uniref:valine--tRNA ligase-like n=1 Tax=Haliotis cracherodii TaxID=6455 RepID=UPI0039EB6BC7
MAASWCHMRFFYQRYGLKIYKGHRIHAASAWKRYTAYSTTTGSRNPEQTSSRVSTPPGEKKDVSGPLPPTYTPEYVESGWYEWWVQQEFFTPQAQGLVGGKEPPFVMVLPPPNVTGTLHLGHALTCSIQDAIIRWNRMRGRETLWVPGCDHAGIATQVVMERKLQQERQQSRHDLGRDSFVEEVWKWKNEKGEIIYEQMKRLGSSLDWGRASFTMDNKLSDAVVEAFVRLHEEGLIYRRNRLVNWSCALRSAISDIEVDGVAVSGRTLMTVPGYDRKIPFGVITSFAYPVSEKDGEVVVSTTRLETMLGDVAVAVHPNDSRYRHLHGCHVRHPVTNQLLPILLDDFVDMEFGTGAVKITPGHDNTDFQVGERHDLDTPTIFTDDGHMVNVTEPFNGMRRFVARHYLAKFLKEKNLFRGEEEHNMTVPVCSRSKDIVEPRLKEQWYVDCHQMAKMAAEVVQSGQLKLIPRSHEKVWLDWLHGIRDWCVSRQLWWGHRIPAYQVTHQGGTFWVSGRTEDEARRKAAKKLAVTEGEITLQQDEDVLDTWFSSAIFPFSVHGWPRQNPDLSHFYPTSLMETGSDIIFFWVARMVMMGLKLTNQLPFQEVLLHGILRDSHGRKMSKSLGNVIDPMDVIHGTTLQGLHDQLKKSNLDPSEVKKAYEGQQKDFPQGIPECGADALRFTLCSYDFKSGEINMDITHARNYRHFCNKVWQAFRFVQTNLGADFHPGVRFGFNETFSAVDQWILSRLSHMIKSCDLHFGTYDLHHVTRALHQFWLTEFSDVYLECVKPVFQSGAHSEQDNVRHVLYHCVDTYLRAISPFMPFLSEELFQRLPARGDNWPVSVCVAQYPQPEDYKWANASLDNTMATVRDIAYHSLSVRKELNLTKTRAANFLTCTDSSQRGQLSDFRLSLQTLSRASDFSVMSDGQGVPDGCLQIQVSDTCSLSVVLKDVINPHEQLPKLRNRQSKFESDLERVNIGMSRTEDKLVTHKMLEKSGKLKAEIEKIKIYISAVENLR